MRSDMFFIFVVGLLCGILLGLFIGHHIYAEDFKFNLTTKMKQDERLTDHCIDNAELNHTMKLADIPECYRLYGGLNSSYGGHY